MAKRRNKTFSGDDLNPEAWQVFLRTQLGNPVAANQQIIFAGRWIEDPSRSRALRRWLNEGCAPSYWSADRFLTAVGMSIDRFHRFCHQLDLSVWARGYPPEWAQELYDEEAV